MARRRTDVTSREYKVMLKPSLFDGDEHGLSAVVDRFWQAVETALEPLGIPAKGSFSEVKARRLIRFFDTDLNAINADSYIVREREDVATGEREVTLKFRHPDRYVASDRLMDPADDSQAKTKFEEDVKPPFVSVFSYSTTQPLSAEQALSHVQDVVDLFPGLPEALDESAHGEELVLVRDFTARELVLEGASLLLGKRDIIAECAMVAWYDEGEADTTPVVIEFSFKYGDDQEDYRGSVARDAFEVLNVLHKGLGDWVDPEPRTKTSFVYS